MDKLISQQAAIEAVEFGITYAKAVDIKTGEVRELFKESNEELMKAAERIKQLPSAQPERKTGRWIPCPQNASWLYVYKCSECGGYLQISDVGGKGYKANYCSYCGARMENGGEQK